MNVSNVGRQCKRKPRLPVLFGNKNGTKEPSPRKSIAVLLCVILIFGMLPTSVFAANSNYEISNAFEANKKIGTYTDHPVYLFVVSNSYNSITVQKPADEAYTSVFLSAGRGNSYTGKSITYLSSEYTTANSFYNNTQFDATIVAQINTDYDHILLRLNKSGKGGGIKGYVIIEWEP